MFLKTQPFRKYGLSVVFTVLLVILVYTIVQWFSLNTLLYDLSFESLTEPSTFRDAELGLMARYLVSLFMPFLGIILALYIGIKFIHRQRFIQLITPIGKLDWRRIAFSGGIWLLICVVIDLLLFGIKPDDYSWYYQNPDFWLSTLIILVLVPFQTSAEEFIFRSYLFQFFNRVTRINFGGVLLSSALFAYMHMQNPEVERYGVVPMAIYYFLFGCVLCIIVLMDNRLELALGIHWANNLYAGVFVTYDGAVLQTDALFSVANIHFPTYAILYLTAAFLVLYIFYKKYHLAVPKQNV